MMGFSVGLATGALFGGFTAISLIQSSNYGTDNKFYFVTRYGLRGRELVGNVGKVMLQSGGTFGTFMAIGSGIRC
ncbi:hypothetical protein HAZT_HAZT000781 [Hyalella azteca]|uniref:Reactive oxygen species modulator 1 n=1 Tax=Hyalella azteca TaxID=294128 RepID=A0A6A0GSC4_HYAAZ|nr:hypothetical protein HAZT_HAZT000781 [Hyalella azteca]